MLQRPGAADGQIQDILRRAAQLAEELPPLYTWGDLCDIIAQVDLARLTRHPTLEALYVESFNPLVRASHGSSEGYLRRQLGWAAPAPDEDGGQHRKAYWERDDVTNVRRNDWPYAHPKDVKHYVVWVDLPLFHPLLCSPPRSASHLSRFAPSTTTSAPGSGASTPSGPSRRNPLASHAIDAALVAPTKGSWDAVSARGLGGLTGAAEKRWRARAGHGPLGKGEHEEGPEREIRAFVERRWRVEDGWETAWFANPPALQSVPGLAHFHVLARRVSSEDGREG
ncbi:hypothetical protein JCM3770_006380 [Rhodotorula araucariae]